ncbi:MAG: zf-HC2 domain-containing protein [Thermoanaerobaculia bacterium]
MSENVSPLTLEEWLRAAYAGDEAGCPPPEAFLEAAELSPAERRRLDEHAGRCPACAAERDLARLFDAAPAAAEVSSQDVDFVVARLKESSPVKPAGKVVRFPAGRAAGAGLRRLPAQAWKLAAAVVLLLGGGLLFRLANPSAPPLPAPGIGGPVRGGEIEAVSPVGDAAGVPSELRWNPRPGAASYRVRLLAVDDAVLWEGTVAAPPARLPAGVQGKLQRAVSYLWTVEALDASGARIASSETVRFRVRP